MLETLGRAIGLFFAFIFFGLIALILGFMLLGSFWLDAAGQEQEAIVGAKFERISFTHANWSRVLELGLHREDGPMAEIRRKMRESNHDSWQMVGLERVRVSSGVYDRYRVGQTVKVRVQSPGFFKDLPLFPQVRLAGQSTYSLSHAFYESAWPFPEFVFSLLPAALLGWLATRTTKWLWALSAVALLVALAYWLSPLSDRRPSGPMGEAEGKVVALKLIEEVGETSESAGFEALVPHWIVGVEFLPEGANGPVVAVDRVDAKSVDLKEGGKVRVAYQRSDPRRALLLDGERTWWWMNIVSVAKDGVLLAVFCGAFWLIGRFFKRLFTRR